jgi:hypothetical protein
MNDIHVTETLPLIQLSTVLLISFLAGLLQSASPDRWIPLSIHSWQRGWDVQRTLLAGAGLLSVHVALGGLLYGVISIVAAPVSGESLSLVAVAVVLLRVMPATPSGQRFFKTMESALTTRIISSLKCLQTRGERCRFRTL